MTNDVRQHEWRRNADGTIDIFAFECGYHNGPYCDACRTGFCHHCDRECYDSACPGGDDCD